MKVGMRTIVRVCLRKRGRLCQVNVFHTQFPKYSVSQQLVRSWHASGLK